MNSMCFSPSWDDPKRWRKKRSSWWIVFLVALIILAVAITLMVPAVAAFIGPVVATFSTAIMATACVAGAVAIVAGVVIAVNYANGNDSKADRLEEAEESVNNSNLSEDEKARITKALNETVNGSVDDDLSLIPDELNPVHQVAGTVKSGLKWIFGITAGVCALAGGYYLMKKDDENNN